MLLSDYYTPENAARALARYSAEYARKAWLLSEKVRMHEEARRAFGYDLAEDLSREAFHQVYDGLRRYWQVFRGSVEHWPEDVAFEIIAIGAEACERAGWQ